MRTIHHFLKETVMHRRTVIPPCDGSSLLLECHLTYSAASGYCPYSSPAVSVHVCGRACTQLSLWSNTAATNATRCSDSCSSTSLSSGPSVLSNNICQVNNKSDGSFVFLVVGNEKSTEQSNSTETHLSNYLYI